MQQGRLGFQVQRLLIMFRAAGEKPSTADPNASDAALCCLLRMIIWRAHAAEASSARCRGECKGREKGGGAYVLGKVGAT